MSTNQPSEVRQDQNHGGGEQDHRSLSDLFVFEHDGGLLIILVVLADQQRCSRPISSLEVFTQASALGKQYVGHANVRGDAPRPALPNVAPLVGVLAI